MTAAPPLISRARSSDRAARTIVISRSIALERRHGELALAAAAVLGVTADAWAGHEPAEPAANGRHRDPAPDSAVARTPGR